jgi:hypothetical protein
MYSEPISFEEVSSHAKTLGSGIDVCSLTDLISTEDKVEQKVWRYSRISSQLRNLFAIQEPQHGGKVF